MNDSSSRHLLIVVGSALLMLIALSALPLGQLTGNVLKDFDLFEDLFPTEHRTISYAEVVEIDEPTSESQTLELRDNIAASETTVAEVLDTDDAITEPVKVVAPTVNIPKTAEGKVLIEDYGPAMFPHFKAALGEADKRTVRIAVIGDSFIEGDIITQDLRELLQSRYGGEGVGYMAMHSDIPGFRKSVRQTDKGWTMHDVRSMKRSDTVRTLSGDYAVAEAGARTSFKGASHREHAATWSRSSVVLLAPQGGSVTLSNDIEEKTYDLQASAEPQRVELSGSTRSFTVKNLPVGAKVTGAYLDGAKGIQVDCMPMRGSSGASVAQTNLPLSQAIAKWYDYDLIIVEFGINALSAEQKNYSPYTATMAGALRRLKRVYPHADILLMGISDRGAKNGTVVTSLPTCDAMVKAQRAAAAECGVHFWDTREAMGGAGSCADWRNRKLMNADYIHLNHEGGAELAKLLLEALSAACNE